MRIITFKLKRPWGSFMDAGRKGLGVGAKQKKKGDT